MRSEASFPSWLNAHWHPPHDRGRWYSVRVDGGNRFEAYLTYSGVWQGPNNEVLPTHNLEYVAMIRSAVD